MKAFWPDQLSYYSHRQLLGAGQYGLVYRVYNPDLQKFTVIKIIEVTQDIRALAVKRFKREIKAIQKVRSPHIVKLMNYWVDPEFLAFEMEYVSGISLRRLIQVLSGIPYSDKQDIILQVILQICKGLRDIHNADLVHRDIKPSNILVELPVQEIPEVGEDILSILRENGFSIKITDFGVVKDLSASVSITRTSDFLGTAAYISPEQAVGSKVDPASDMYALGIIWYEMVTGKNPFQRKNIYQTIQAHIQEEPPDIRSYVPEFPLDLNHIILLLLHKEPGQRFYTSHRLLQLLEQQSGELTVGDYDVSLLLTSTRKSGEICSCYEQFLNFLTGKSSETGFFLLSYRNSVEKHHFVNHLRNGDSPPDTRMIYFLSRLYPDFIFSLVQTLLLHLSRQETEEFRKELPSDSLEEKLLQFLLKNDFYRQCDFGEKHFKLIPFHLKMFNWMQFTTALLHFMSTVSPVYIFLDEMEDILPSYRSFLLPVWERLKDRPIHWIFCSKQNVAAEMEALFSPALTVQSLSLEDFFSADSDCVFNDRNFQSSEEIYPEFPFLEISPATGGLTDLPDLNPEEIRFLKYFAVSGMLNPVEYVNWLLEKYFDRKGGLMLTLINKNVLQHFPVNPASYLISFSNKKDYLTILANLDKKERNKILDSVITFWDNRPGLEARERITFYLWQAEEFSRLGHLLEDLFNFYYFTADIYRRDKLFEFYRKLKEKYRVPQILDFHLRIHRLVNLQYHKAFDSVVQNATPILEKLSSKYQVEKHRLTLMVLINLLCMDRLETADQILKNVQEGKSISEEFGKSLNFLRAILWFKQGKWEEARQLMSDVLITLNDTAQFWNIPTGSYLIARVYSEQGEWEKAFRYAAMAFQAARVINDFWVMDRCLKVIENNPYYQMNRQNMLNWGSVRKKLLNFSLSAIELMDLRTELLRVIH